MNLKRTIINDITAFYRPGIAEQGSDLDALQEVISKRCYAAPGFDVEPGESWLDLGANIGAFGLYCSCKDGFPTCYEPDDNCYKVLLKNLPAFPCIHAAVTASQEDELSFYSREPKNPDNHWRGTVIQNFEPEKYGAIGKVNNTYAGNLRHLTFDGIKMDIEGSEGPIIDEWLLPSCRKLVLEYHTCRDSSVANLKRRLDIIKSKFYQVTYPSEYDEVIAAGYDFYRPQFDNLIFAKDPK